MFGKADLVVQWRKGIVGDWLTVSFGPSLLDQEPVKPKSQYTIRYQADGTVLSRLGETGDFLGRPGAPFPETWEITDDRILWHRIPLPPIPEPQYEQPDWYYDSVFEDVLTIDDHCMALSNLRFDGEFITLYKRVSKPPDDYNCRE